MIGAGARNDVRQASSRLWDCTVSVPMLLAASREGSVSASSSSSVISGSEVPADLRRPPRGYPARATPPGRGGRDLPITRRVAWSRLRGLGVTTICTSPSSAFK